MESFPFGLRRSLLSYNDSFGVVALIDNGNCLASAPGATVRQVADNGACYFFRNFQTGPVVDAEEVKLIPSDDFTGYSAFGTSVALSRNIALVTRLSTYSIYVYQRLDTAEGTITEDAQIDTYKGGGISLYGTDGLLGTSLYRHLDEVIGNPAPNVLLGTSDLGSNNYYCSSNSLSGKSALVGYVNNSPQPGGTYYYRDLSTASGTVTEDAKLISPESRPNGRFGSAVALSGSRALVGAPELEIDGDRNRGETYYYRNLNLATGPVAAQARLQANPAYLKKEYDVYFGQDIDLSGENALIGALDSACLYLRLDQASGITYEGVKIYNSHPPEDYPNLNDFGSSVSLDGDTFAIGDPGKDLGTGVVYTGSVSALTTNDFGNSRRVAAYVSFISHLDWIAGGTTDGNQIALTVGDTATVKDAGKAVYIGKKAGSDNNLLDIAGTLNATYVYIGSPAGNTGNTLRVESAGKISATALRLAKGNRLLIHGSPAAAQAALQAAPLQVFVSGAWKTVTQANYQNLITISQSDGYTIIVPTAC